MSICFIDEDYLGKLLKSNNYPSVLDISEYDYESIFSDEKENKII